MMAYRRDLPSDAMQIVAETTMACNNLRRPEGEPTPHPADPQLQLGSNDLYDSPPEDVCCGEPLLPFRHRSSTVSDSQLGFYGRRCLDPSTLQYLQIFVHSRMLRRD